MIYNGWTKDIDERTRATNEVEACLELVAAGGQDTCYAMANDAGGY